jgi:hypothetical protein
VTLRSTEKLTGQVIPDIARAARPGSMWVAVHLQLDFLDSGDADRERHLEHLISEIRLQLPDGEEVEPIMAPMTESHLKMLKYGRTATFEDVRAWAATSEWKRVVVVFAPPEDSRGLTLRIDNYDRREGQPRSAEIYTGR